MVQTHFIILLFLALFLYTLSPFVSSFFLEYKAHGHSSNYRARLGDDVAALPANIQQVPSMLVSYLCVKAWLVRQEALINKQKFLNGLGHHLTLLWGPVGIGQFCDTPVFLPVCDSSPRSLVQLGTDFSKTSFRKPQVTDSGFMMAFGFKIKDD